RRHRDCQAAVHEGSWPAASSGALGDAGGSGASCIHRVDGTRQTPSFPISGRPHGQGCARGGAGGVMVTHPDKLLFPDDGITKGELASYYEAVAPVMLPHMQCRPVTMERYHGGI